MNKRNGNDVIWYAFSYLLFGMKSVAQLMWLKDSKEKINGSKIYIIGFNNGIIGFNNGILLRNSAIEIDLFLYASRIVLWLKHLQSRKLLWGACGCTAVLEMAVNKYVKFFLPLHLQEGQSCSDNW